MFLPFTWLICKAAEVVLNIASETFKNCDSIKNDHWNKKNSPGLPAILYNSRNVA